VAGNHDHYKERILRPKPQSRPSQIVVDEVAGE
jgi:hypothetical protein